MRLLHTSDWHIGRTFHGHSTLPALREVLAALVEQVRENAIGGTITLSEDELAQMNAAVRNHTLKIV